MGGGMRRGEEEEGGGRREDEDPGRWLSTTGRGERVRCTSS
jgi:hypothetical protein